MLLKFHFDLIFVLFVYCLLYHQTVLFVFPKTVKLHPLTVAQNSLHGVFGQSGYIQAVPPCAATIGPVDVKNARERIEVHALMTNGTFSSWQRMTSRLVLHGPVTPEVPSSMLQLMKTQVLVSDELAAPFECWEKVGY